MVICRGDEFLQYLGYKKEGNLKNYLYFDHKIMNVNEQNKHGETLIFVASYFCELEMVSYLLSIGADPNLPNRDGNTALHAAAYFDNVKLLQVLVDSGGDLRLANSDGARPCQLMRDAGGSKQAHKVRLFEQTLYRSLVTRLAPAAGPVSLSAVRRNCSSLWSNWPKIGKSSGHKATGLYFSVQTGFGNYICQNKTIKGLISSTKVIQDSKSLVTDLKAKVPQIPCGLYTKFINKLWNTTPVSVKIISLFEGKENVSDRRTNILTNQMIKEVDILGPLRHPNILLLMAINLILDEPSYGVQYELVFERFEEGTIYHFLHSQKREFNYYNLITILSSLLEALSYIQSQGIVHGSISSNSVFLVNDNVAKLGNFENALELKKYENKKCNLSIQQWNSYNFYNNLDNIFKWLAPEVLHDNFVVSASIDIYGFAVVVWECFTGVMPHKNKTFKSLLRRYSPPYTNELSSKIPEQLLPILHQSFKQDMLQRPQINKFQEDIYELNQCSSSEMEIKSYKKLGILIPDNDIKIENRNEHNNIKKVAVNANEDDISSSTSSTRKPLKKSNSFNCVIENENSEIKKRDYLNSITKEFSNPKLTYRNLAAIPNPQVSETNWKYPSPQTEFIIEGRGNLSNTVHRDSITRGMKPASHQTCLSTSQTNICSLLGTTDLIKSSSKGSLQRNSSTNSLNKLNRYANHPITSKQMFSSYKTIQSNQFNEKVKANQIHNSKIFQLIQKYENCVSHPYSSSNCSTPTTAITRSLSNKTSPNCNTSNSVYSGSSSKSSVVSPPSSSTISSRKKQFFSSISKRNQNEWASTTEEEEINKKNTYSKPSRSQKPQLFGDITNNFRQNLR